MTDKIDFEKIAQAAVEKIQKEFKTGMPAIEKSIVHEAKKRFEEAYVPQQKSYSLTTDHISEPAKQDHEKLYKNYVEKLERVSIEVDSADRTAADANHSDFRSCKRDEIFNMNAVYLHELFFANCFYPNSELYQESLSYIRISSDWGNFDSWMSEFMACAASARNGWVVLGYSLYLKKMINVFIDGHDGNVPFGIIPVIVIDMWEHAYVRDYGTDKKAYLSAMMGEINWEVVEERVKRLDQAKRVLP